MSKVAEGAGHPALLTTVAFQQQNTNADSRTLLRDRLQGYVADVVSYAEELLGAWEQRPAAQLTTEFGVSLAVGVVRTLRGLSESGCRLECPQGGEPLWRRLKWGMTIAARAFDVSAAPGNFSQSFKEEDLVSKSAGAGYGFGVLLLLTYESACRRVREVVLYGYTLSPRFHTSWTAFFRMLLFVCATGTDGLVQMTRAMFRQAPAAPL